MIISKKNGFIFVRVLKTGSTSAHAMLINSGILGPNDIYSGYRNNVFDKPTASQNIPTSINGKQIREISPYDIPKEIYVKGDGTFPMLGHLAPTEMVGLGLITEEELMKYTLIGGIREPIERFLSAWFFYCDLVKKPKTKQAILSDFKKEISMPNTFLGKSQKNYFEYNGKLLKNIRVIRQEDLNKELENVIHQYGGTISKFETLKNHHRPAWSRQPYKDWLPEDIQGKLQKLMKEDVVFYNQHAK